MKTITLTPESDSSFMTREVKLNNQLIRRLFIRYHGIVDTLHHLEENPLTPSLTIMTRLERKKQWLRQTIYTLLKS